MCIHRTQFHPRFWGPVMPEGVRSIRPVDRTSGEPGCCARVLTMTAAEHPAPDLGPGSDPLQLARLRHLSSCAQDIRRLRGLFVPTPADRLALAPTSLAYDAAPEPSDMLAWTRLRRAAFAAGDQHQLDPRERLLLMAIAVQHAASRPLVFSHGTASAILQLPEIGPATELVEFATPPGARGRKSQARRRRTSLPPAQLEVEGLLVTDFDRTIIDRARSSSLESAVAAADAALRLGVVDRDALLAQVRALPRRSRGCKMAELVVCLADACAESPLESLSRTRMFQLGLPMPERQVEFYDASGFIGRVDFYWRQLGIIGEADGRLKFRVAEGLTGRAAEEAVWRAKRRDDRLRRHPAVRNVGHWDWDEAMSAPRFAAALADMGVRPARDDAWPVPDGPLPRKSRHTSVIERTHNRTTGP